MSHYYRKAIYTVERVLPHVYFQVTGKPNIAKNTLVDFEGDLINMGSTRYRMFVKKGLDCVVLRPIRPGFFVIGCLSVMILDSRT